MKRVDTTNVQEAGEFTRLPAGAYVCVIRDAKDVPDKEYLELHFDIAAGEFKGYYDEFRASGDGRDWAGRLRKSYKPKALPFFKRFCTAVSRSNGNFVFDGGNVNSDESTLVGKKIGLVLQEEEYYSNSGELKTKLEVYKEFPIDQINAQKVPNPKRVSEDEKPANATAKSADDSFINVPEGTDDEVPFN